MSSRVLRKAPGAGVASIDEERWLPRRAFPKATAEESLGTGIVGGAKMLPRPNRLQFGCTDRNKLWLGDAGVEFVKGSCARGRVKRWPMAQIDRDFAGKTRVG